MRVLPLNSSPLDGISPRNGTTTASPHAPAGRPAARRHTPRTRVDHLQVRLRAHVHGQGLGREARLRPRRVRQPGRRKHLMSAQRLNQLAPNARMLSRSASRSGHLAL